MPISPQKLSPKKRKIVLGDNFFYPKESFNFLRRKFLLSPKLFFRGYGGLKNLDMRGEFQA